MVPSSPPSADLCAWRKFVAAAEKDLKRHLCASAKNIDVSIHCIHRAGIPTYEVTVPEPIGNKEDTIIFLHGGALVLGGGKSVEYAATLAAKSSRRRVIAIDFRNPPDHPFPAALEDCLAVYEHVITTTRPTRLVLVGRSSGGNLAVAVTLKLMAAHLPTPAAVALFTPELDLTESGDSFRTLRGLDVVLQESLAGYSALYAGTHSLLDPEISPLWAKIPKTFPPTFLQSGTRDLFLSNTVLMHRKLRRAGVPADLHVWEAMPHGGFGGDTPEDAEVEEEYRRFLAKHLV